MSARLFRATERQKLQHFPAPAAHASPLHDRPEPADGVAAVALEAMVFGAVICDAGGHVIFANRAAEVLARNGCGVRLGGPSGRIAATLPHDASRLAQLLKDATGRGRAGAMAAYGGNGERLFLLVTPLPQHRALIAMRAADTAPRVNAEILMNLFNLTPSEARVGAALSTGAGVTEIAATFDVGEETVRTHVKRLLDKAGAANQREFLAMVALLPPIDCAATDMQRVSVQLPAATGISGTDRPQLPSPRCAVLKFTGPDSRRPPARPRNSTR
jgi:DNA-binding CsgD family transcriptional regulator